VKRILTALVLLPLFLFAVLMRNPLYFAALVALAAVAAAYEFYALAAASNAEPFRWLGLVWTEAVIAAAVWPEKLPFAWVVTGGLLVVMIWGLLSLRDLKKVLGAVSSTTFGVFYVGFLLGIVVEIKMAGPVLGTKLIFLLCSMVWIGDSMAYYVGKGIGKHKLFPSVSPKKTWEGAAANALGGVLAAVFASLTYLTSVSVLQAVVVGLVVTTAGQMGDLFESALKRGASLKDSSSLLPGHGGVLDRMDSILLSAPFLLLYHRMFLG
jgi:phosphatidate cytidylyltransferase